MDIRISFYIYSIIQNVEAQVFLKSASLLLEQLGFYKNRVRIRTYFSIVVNLDNIEKR